MVSLETPEPERPDRRRHGDDAGCSAGRGASRGSRHSRLRAHIRRSPARAKCVRAASDRHRDRSASRRDEIRAALSRDGCRVQPAGAGRSRRRVGFSERGSRRRRHPQTRAARSPSSTAASIPGSRSRRSRRRQAHAIVALRIANVNASVADDRQPDRTGRRKEQPVAALSREEADVPVPLGGGCSGRPGAGRGAARQDRVRRHNRARHARGGGHAARYAVRRRRSPGHGRRQPPASRTSSAGPRSEQRWKAWSCSFWASRWPCWSHEPGSLRD